MHVLAVLVIAAATSAAIAADPSREPDPPPRQKAVDLELPVAGVDELRLEHRSDGSYRYILVRDDGRETSHTPEQFTALLFEDQTGRPWWYILMNITTPAGIAWVTLGLLGQVLFTGRMLVQWLVSEKHHRSVIPTAFWWMSLLGATMLMAYFAWRKDPVGFLGQGAGWLIYIRNLYLIHTTPQEGAGKRG